MTQNEIYYLNAIMQAKSMHQKGIIDENDFYKIERMLAKKYSLKNINLYRKNDWINSSRRVIYMIPSEGGFEDNDGS